MRGMLWPFMLKSKVLRMIKEEKLKSTQAEHARTLFKKYDAMFEELPAIELTRDHRVVAGGFQFLAAGFALIDEDGKPMAMAKFQTPKVLIPEDQLIITLGRDLAPSYPAGMRVAA
ncbi:MAG: hypothetical protein U9Q17_03400 [Chloroflexota bacterium]|nr:hypothetical protein [Chloroflexota bacterium]